MLYEVITNSCVYQMLAQPFHNDRTRIKDIAGLFIFRGQVNIPAILSLLDACDMWEEIGRDRIEAYVCELSSYLKKQIKEKFGESVTLFAPDIPEFTSGLTSYNPRITSYNVCYTKLLRGFRSISAGPASTGCR